MKKRKKTREIQFPMKFNPGSHKYEPELPLVKTKKKLQIKVDWGGILIILGFFILLIGALFWVIKKWI